MTTTQAHNVFDILVRVAGTNPGHREAFVHAMARGQKTWSIVGIGGLKSIYFANTNRIGLRDGENESYLDLVDRVNDELSKIKG